MYSITSAVHIPYLSLFKQCFLSQCTCVIFVLSDKFIQKMRYISVDIPHYVIVLFTCSVYSKPKLYS
uniref:Uncharacterized protein n=1 Tax=Siphoviridae sp. ctybZ1 TaxID=2825746 RepID=A0A8S5NT86_9CAUD|nr:MAG TPA: hypothetical protein [Siphoviridae sp. ctybZ1]